MEIRPVGRAEAKACGALIYKAFHHFAVEHDEPPSFPSPEAATLWVSLCFQRPRFTFLGAFLGERLVGLFALDGRAAVAGFGPVVVDPEVKDPFLAVRLFQALIATYRQSGFQGARATVLKVNKVRLLQQRMGMEEREPFSLFQGPARGVKLPGRTVRPMTQADVARCNELCTHCYGFTRELEVAEAVRFRSGLVVERGGQVTGYTTAISTGGHSVGLSNEDLQALILGTPRFPDGGFNVPDGNTELVQWCLDQGFTRKQNQLVMSLDAYHPPRAPHLLSLYF